MAAPRIILDKIVVRSPWVDVLERHVEFDAGSAPQVYHCVDQPDYVTVVPVDRSGHVALVRQYRPAMQDYTWEFPAGTVDAGEAAETAAKRELGEEAGLEADVLHDLGSFAVDTGRLCNRIHNFLAEIDSSQPPLTPEAGMEARWLPFADLVAMIRARRFSPQLQVAALMLALLHPRARSAIAWRESGAFAGPE